MSQRPVGNSFLMIKSEWRGPPDRPHPVAGRGPVKQGGLTVFRGRPQLAVQSVGGAAGRNREGTRRARTGRPRLVSRGWSAGAGGSENVAGLGSLELVGRSWWARADGLGCWVGLMGRAGGSGLVARGWWAGVGGRKSGTVRCCREVGRCGGGGRLCGWGRAWPRTGEG